MIIWKKVAVVAAASALITLASVAPAAVAHTTDPVDLLTTSAATHDAPGTVYPRAIQLQHNGTANGRILATHENYTIGNNDSFPIYRSDNEGVSWSVISQVTDTQNGWGMRFQPQLFEMPQTIGSLSEGTILAAGMSFYDGNSNTYIDMYKSTDLGVTWTYVNRIAAGGSINSSTPVWEPYFVVANNKLIVYYSDETDPTYDQKLVHKTSTDGMTWSSAVTDVASPSQSARPGMPIVTKLGDGRYMYTYEVLGYPNQPYGVRYKFSTDPENFGTGEGTYVTVGGTVFSGGTPYVSWLPTGGPQGTIVLSANYQDQLVTNTQGGATGAWQVVSSPVAQGYSRSMLPLSDGHRMLIITAGNNDNPGYNKVTAAVMDFGQDTPARYEAEDGVRNLATKYTSSAASNNAYLGHIDDSNAYVDFNIWAPTSGVYSLDIRYANGGGAPSTQLLAANGSAYRTVTYPATSGWGSFATKNEPSISLNSGFNVVRLKKGDTGYAELDYVAIHATDARFEAEQGVVYDAQVRTLSSASAGAFVGGIDGSISHVDFSVWVPTAGAYTLNIRYANGGTVNSEHKLGWNGGPWNVVSYPPTGAWGSFATKQVTNVNLNAGFNTVRLEKGSVGYAELDYVAVSW